MARSERLPELHYFLNNGRDDITPEEQTTILTLIGKSMCFEAKGQDGAMPAEIKYTMTIEGPSFPNGDGVSLQEFGLEGRVVAEVVPENEAPGLPDETEFDEAEHPDDYGNP